MIQFGFFELFHSLAFFFWGMLFLGVALGLGQFHILVGFVLVIFAFTMFFKALGNTADAIVTIANLIDFGRWTKEYTKKHAKLVAKDFPI
jgi:hypothetical protein